MKIAILCNNGSSQASTRTELVDKLMTDNDVYFFGIQENITNEYYSKYTSWFLPIIASRNNTNPFKEIKSITSVKKQVKTNR